MFLVIKVSQWHVVFLSLFNDLGVDERTEPNYRAASLLKYNY